MENIEFIDLGLSVNWAKCNLGAEKETDYGHYYMWGSTKPNDNDDCSWKNAVFNNGFENFNKEYFDSVKNKVCPNGILASEYDIAYKESNGNYRIPSKDEMDELLNNTNNEWVDNYNGTGINGYKFTNKTDETKYIFIPAAGYRDDLNTCGVSYTCNVWSNTVFKDFHACYLDLNKPKFYSIVNNLFGGSHYYGKPIRAVCKK